MLSRDDEIIREESGFVQSRECGRIISPLASTPPLNSRALYGIIPHHYAFFKSRMSAGKLCVSMAGNSHVKLHAYPSFDSMFISIQAASSIGEIAGH